MSFIETTYSINENDPDKVRTNFADITNGLSDGTKDLNVGEITASKLNVDTISEKTGAAGVTVDGLLIKDGSTNNEYHYVTKATTSQGAADLALYPALSFTVTLAGTYLIMGHATCWATGTYSMAYTYIKTGSSTYASATQRTAQNHAHPNSYVSVNDSCIVALAAGDTVHYGVEVYGTSGTRYCYGDNFSTGCTNLLAYRIGT